jgi:6,7-dimethyl-8-ribityllumazine synthase
MAGTKVAYIQASWHTEITDTCKEAFIDEMSRRGHAKADLEFFRVPGSLEIPLTAKRLAKSGLYGAICASGLVVDGGIYRHEFVAQAVLNGIVQVSLDTDVPVLSAVLTPQSFRENSEPHEAFFVEHMRVKGRELAEACSAVLGG